MKTLVVLPSYNERENISKLIDTILSLSKDYHVCVVDDNSPDGTANVIREQAKNRPTADQCRLKLIVRDSKSGRGGAVRAGMQWGLSQTEIAFKQFVEMDCDFSHPPKDIPLGVAMLKDFDVVLGSRYPDGKVINWPLSRRVFSFCANLLIRTLVTWKIADYTNGYRFYNLSAATLMCQLPQNNKGYIYLSETLTAFLKNKMTIGSFPIIFVNRERGVSNTNSKEITAALRGVFSIAWNYRFGK